MIDDEMGDKAKAIASHYGLRNQLVKLIEEMGELTVAIAKHILNPTIESKAHVIEEMSDVYLMLYQIAFLMDITTDDVKPIVRYKIIRQLIRINKETENADN